MKTRHLLIPFALALALGLVLLWLLSHRAAPAIAGPAQRAVERPAERPLPNIRHVTPTRDGGNAIEAATSGPFCEPMSPPSGNVIEVYPSQASELDSTVQAAATGDTILLHDGTYELHGDYLWFSTPGVTMRSASGNREAVVIDGNYETTEMVTVNASNVTIADLTLKRAQTHPIHVTPPHDADITATLIYNVHIIDPGEQAIKINFAGRDALFSSQYGFDCGICLEQACGTQVLHNTVASTQSPFSSIEWRWTNTDAEITNNLVSHNLRERDGASASLAGNLEGASLSLFAGGGDGDLHLTESASSAIGQGVNAGVTTDIDGQTRDSDPDIGADEYDGVYLSSSRKMVYPEEAGTGEALTYTVVLYNTGIFSATDIRLFDAIPAHTTYVSNSAHASSGVTTDTGGIGWTGTVTLNDSVTITFRVTVNEQALIENTAVVTDQYGTPTTLTAWVNAKHVYLPAVLQQYP
jgi:uncharacterized repeat protein (TIGR01451 family)